MERERAESKYGQDPRVRWIPASKILCRVDAADVPTVLPQSDLGWDGKIYSDEWVEFGEPNENGVEWKIFLATVGSRRSLMRWGGYHNLDRALAVVLGEPRS